MGKIGTKLPNFCLNRIRPHVRVRSPTIQSKPDVSDVAKKSSDGKFEDSRNVGEEEKVKAAAGGGGDENPKKAALVIARKIMIVVDSSLEAKGAIQWALSHTVQSQDKIVLLHVTKSANSKKGEETSKEIAPSPRAYALVHSLRNMCQLKRPEVEIEVAVVVEGNKEKGPKILEEAKKQEVGLLVLGQKKRSTTWRLLVMWTGNRVSGGRGGVVEYCIQNASCMAVAVRRKSRKVGGYLITTKRQKDFWLLA
ncbi:universal stress protein PHOS32-like isoform X2 [Pyrus x bretschneideri]|uniref:universal stress protein PHOS32-like isoform X2 n=1 Tax=Pyrus x bretschneideri TaxID=225117 RepID=UPI00202EBC6B|nr:universal stress protein PHOS32-like isoform X2 [Pyrus x bretschneideri]